REMPNVSITLVMSLVSIEARSASKSASSARPSRSSLSASVCPAASPSSVSGRPVAHSPILYL
ncbi:MAG: hypothetical protein ACRDY0_08570, partial [Acidimicrobiales bacterium]